MYITRRVGHTSSNSNVRVYPLISGGAKMDVVHSIIFTLNRIGRNGSEKKERKPSGNKQHFLSLREDVSGHENKLKEEIKGSFIWSVNIHKLRIILPSYSN